VTIEPNLPCAVAIEKTGIELVGVPRRRHRTVLEARNGPDERIAVGRNDDPTA
jgi:hypothetical protein